MFSRVPLYLFLFLLFLFPRPFHVTREKRIRQDEKGENKFPGGGRGKGAKSNDRDMKLGEFHSLASYANSPAVSLGPPLSFRSLSFSLSRCLSVSVCPSLCLSLFLSLFLALYYFFLSLFAVFLLLYIPRGTVDTFIVEYLLAAVYHGARA